MVITVAVKVECESCGKHITIIDVTDDQKLIAHVRLHLFQDESFRKEFNDSPLKFPIHFSEVEGDEYGW